MRFIQFSALIIINESQFDDFSSSTGLSNKLYNLEGMWIKY